MAAALVGALGEALVGPLSPGRRQRRDEALVAAIVQFTLNAFPRKERPMTVLDPQTRMR